MELRFELETGWPSQLTTMERRIGGFKRHASAFKIGITNDPWRRMREYEVYSPRHYSEMIVLYETSSFTHAADLERRLINHQWYDPRIRNQISGGGGRPGAGWYYLYVVRRRRNNAF